MNSFILLLCHTWPKFLFRKSLTHTASTMVYSSLPEITQTHRHSQRVTHLASLVVWFDDTRTFSLQSNVRYSQIVGTGNTIVSRRRSSRTIYKRKKTQNSEKDWLAKNFARAAPVGWGHFIPRFVPCALDKNEVVALLVATLAQNFLELLAVFR